MGVGRRELMAIGEEDTNDRKVVNQIRNMTGLVFMDLLEIQEVQSEYRAMNMARKRSKSTITTTQSLEASTQTSLEGISPAPCI